MTAQESIDAIERDRKRRERELLLLFLLIMGQTRRYAIHAIRLGIEPINAMRTVWLGSEHFRGIVTPMARVMADAHIAGYERAANMVGTETPAPASESLVWYYTPKAQVAAEQMLGTMSAKVSTALSGVSDPKAVIITIRQAFEDGGYTVENPTALERGAEVAVVQSGNDGAANAMQQPDTRHYGYRHYSVLDKGTTAICRQRDKITLPRDSNYWKQNWPALHFGCRSIVLPWMQEGTWSTVPNNLAPPAEGFGVMPNYLWAGLERAAAA